MTTTPTPPLALPALPEPHPIAGEAGRHCVVWGKGYDAADMNAHATAAILSDRAGRGAAAEPDPMFYGRWHHGNGNLCCGSMRYFRADFDTQPAPDVREGIFDWVCTTMNAALDRWRDQKRAREFEDFHLPAAPTGEAS